MTETKNYTFRMKPNTKFRYIAGEYNINTKKPEYRISISAPSHERDFVNIKQILLGDKNYCNWGWDIHNNSSWEIFVTITKDGIPIYKNEY